MNCPHCESTSVHKRSVQTNLSGDQRQRYRCNNCTKWFSVRVNKETFQESEVKNFSGVKRFVITSCQNNATVNEEFLSSLASYCDKNDAELLVVPIMYRPKDHKAVLYNIPDDVDYTMVTHKMRLHDEVYVMGSFNFIPTTVNPLQGLESLSKGDTLIVPSPQLRMKSLAVSATRHPAILHTTGAISNPEYTNTKVGEKALFNHSYSAVVLEIDSDNDFHIRVLNAADDGSFIDLGDVYYPDGQTGWESPAAMVTGDEHAIFACPEVEGATYTNHDSIVRVLQPQYVVRGDVLDAYAVSHHTRKDTLKNIGKNLFGLNRIEDELKTTVAYIRRTSAAGDFENVFVASNHNSHLTEWLSNIDIKTEPWNAKIYFWLMYRTVCTMKQTDIGFSHDDPFHLYCESAGLERARFLGRDESFRIADVELSMHGDKGPNGARGSLSNLSNLCDKVVVGHSHTPGIISGAYQVGTSSRKKLEYTSGPSSWLSTHCLVYAGGKRQLINIINGKWKA